MKRREVIQWRHVHTGRTCIVEYQFIHGESISLIGSYEGETSDNVCWNLFLASMPNVDQDNPAWDYRYWMSTLHRWGNWKTEVK